MDTPIGKTHSGLIFSLVIAALVIGGISRAGIIRKSGPQVFGAQKASLIAANSAPVSLANFKNGFASVIEGRSKYKAKVIGTDPRTDIAVLKIDATGLPTLTLGESSRLKVGDILFANRRPGIGNQPVLLLVNHAGGTQFVVLQPQ